MTLDELRQELKSGRLRPVYLLLGPELYLRNQAVAGFKRAAVTPESMAFDYAEFGAKTASAGEIAEAANTFPMISRHRLVIVSDVDSFPAADQEKLLDYLERPASRTVLVLMASTLDKRTVYTKRLCERSCVVDLSELKGAALKSWAADLIHRRKRRISPPALDKLMDLAGSDTLSIANEVEKLILYSGEEVEITEAAVEEVVPSTRQHALYEMTDAICRKDRRAAIRLMANVLDSGLQPLYVLAALARHFRQVLIARELLDSGQDSRAIAAAAQVNHPRGLESLIRTARAIDLATAREMCLKTAEADRRLKSSGVDDRLILESLIHSV